MKVASRFCWMLNLDAELELVRRGYTPRVQLQEQLRHHGQRARDLLGAEDVLLEPGSPAPANLTGTIGRAWCPTPLAIATLRAAGVEPEPHPEATVLRRVNHRFFAHELGLGLPGQKYFRDQLSLEALIPRAERPWLVKRPLAFAGRGQQRFYGTISQAQRAWLEASLRHDGLLIEPLVRPTLELSLHGFVWRDGRSELGRICVQEVSYRGVFRGVRPCETNELDADESAALLTQGARVASALAAAGYFGPFGVDAYRYTLDGASGFCALSEINARYTMGFRTGFPRPPSELLLV